MSKLISAALLNWKRPYHLPEIIESIRAQGITDIVIWDNSGELPALDGARVFHSENLFTYGRFCAAKLCKHETIFTQDDDLIVENIPELIEQFRSEACQKVIANLVDDKSSRHWTWWQFNSPPYVELGFGSIFPKAWAGKLDAWPYDRDLLHRKADKVFTVSHPWKAVYGAVRRLYHEGRESGRDENALFKREDHKRLTEEAVRLTREWLREAA